MSGSASSAEALLHAAKAVIGFLTDSEVGSFASTWIAARNMPERFVDYSVGAQVAQLTAAQNVLALISLIGFLIMLAGWPILAIAAARRAK